MTPSTEDLAQMIKAETRARESDRLGFSHTMAAMQLVLDSHGLRLQELMRIQLAVQDEQKRQGERLDTIEGRLNTIEGGLDTMGRQLEEILSLLRR